MQISVVSNLISKVARKKASKQVNKKANMLEMKHHAAPYCAYLVWGMNSVLGGAGLAGLKDA